MELIPLLSTIVLVATIVTIIFAIFSYAAYRSREKRMPPLRSRSAGGQIPLEPQFFRRYQPPR